MTVFYATPYVVGGLEVHGGDREVHHDPMPESLRKVWEIDPADPWDKTPWVLGDDGLWTVEGEADEGLALSWTELLDEFAPVSDVEADAAIGLDALAVRNAEHRAVTQ